MNTTLTRLSHHHGSYYQFAWQDANYIKLEFMYKTWDEKFAEFYFEYMYVRVLQFKQWWGNFQT